MRRAVLIATTLVGSWLAMQAVHETGHVLGAWLTGGRVESVVLDPLSLSRTDYIDNPEPLVVAWSAAVFGVVAPLLLWATGRGRLRYLARFFAGFCLVANGVYIGIGAVTNAGDSATLLSHGSPRWLLLLFAAATAPLGLWLWHGEGPHFGLVGGEPVRLSDTIVTSTVCAILLLVGFATRGH